jgi:hypothetical protein
MNLQSIISEADILVPNEVDTGDKLIVLDSLNRDFFNVVKIPRVAPFTPVKDQATYTLPTDVRLKNIDLIMCGVIKYKELMPNTPNPLQNTFTFDDSTYLLTLRPAPYQAGLQAIVRYNRIATTTFEFSNLLATPDSPLEYHYSLVIGLASYLAAAMDDMGKAATYESQYLAVWAQAATQYAGVTANG